MENGISVYPGLDNTLEENLTLIEQAAKHGIHRLFTSLHIPETNVAAMKQELAEILRCARENDMEVISDISPATRELLGIEDLKPSTFRLLGISTLRLDYGFGLEEIADMSNNTQGIRIQLNASTITEQILSALVEYEANFHQIDALHNFYPRRGTGLSRNFLLTKNSLLHALGIKVGAFVASAGRARSPLKDGLPTLEDHRHLHADDAARQLAAFGIDSVFIGDSLPTDAEIAALGKLSNDKIVLKAKLLTNDATSIDLLTHEFHARADEARDCIRAAESRTILKAMGGRIKPQLCAGDSCRGMITLDNEGYQRYMGELQIIKNPQPMDTRTNVVARLVPEDLPLLDFLRPGQKFSFQFVK